MQNHLSDRVNSLSESATLAMTRRSRELKEAGIDVINLSIGEPDFNTPECIKDAAIEAISNNITHYPPVAGYNELRAAISKKFKQENNLDYSPDQIIVSGGAKQSITNTILCLINPGDEVLIPEPYWVSYPEMVKLAEGKSVYIPSTIENDFKVKPEDLKSKITSRSKVFLFSSPCNPSGTIYSKEELKALAEVVAEKDDLYIISDEIYEQINFNGKHESIAQFDFIKDRVITVNGVSKGFAMTGWRIGYIGAPKTVAQACNTLQGQYTSGTSSISQMAALKAIQTGPNTIAEMREMKQAFRERRDLVIKRLETIPGIKANIPEGAFYIFPDISSYFGKTDGLTVINDGMDLCFYLLDKARVALVPGSAFGSPEYIRISYAASAETLHRAFDRIESALAALK
ncbi:MAG: pyridoxal phosphate-dependent aminotransferase [Bacteroidales bacterium]|nr:pyridoxal phosphate-dependent aminotransferase [Bacteroidales bacterium]